MIKDYHCDIHITHTIIYMKEYNYSTNEKIFT
jgi:hypothetical protein